jgi:hypothetical protein
MNGGEEECIWVLIGKPEGKRLLGMPRRGWVNNIKMDVGGDRMGWYRLD